MAVDIAEVRITNYLGTSRPAARILLLDFAPRVFATIIRWVLLHFISL